MLKVIAPLTVVFALSLGAISCTTTSPSDPHLAGRWQLDKSSSDDADAKISAAIGAAESKLRKRLSNAGFSQYDQPTSPHHGRGGSGANPPGDAGELNGEEFSQTGYIGPDFNALRRNLRRVLGSPNSLTIDVKPDYVRLAGDDAPPRDYPPDDEFIRMDEYGTARIDTSWSGSSFHLRARYQSKATVTESYTADEHAGTLTVVRYLIDPVAGKLTVHSLYRR
jgi:hypothetical protein